MRSWPLALLLVLHTHNSTDGNKLMIFSGIALCYGDTYIIKILFSVPAGVPASLAGKIYWICKALEERVENSIITRKFLEGTLVKKEVEKRAGDL